MSILGVKGLGGLSHRDRRALAWGALVLVPALAFHVALKPYARTLSGVRERIARERALLEREQGLLAEAKDYPVRFHRAEAALWEEAPRLFAGPDLVAASAALSNYVTGRAATHRVFVQTSETRVAQPAGEGVAKFQVEIRAVGDLEGLLALLHGLETGPKLVSIERLSIAPAEQLHVGEPRDEEVLGISATVTGYALTEFEGAQDSDSLARPQERR